MAFITYPLNNIDYTAEDAELFHCTRTSGVWAKDSFPISVTGANNNVTIGKGIAWINNKEFSGKVIALKAAETLDLGIADNTYPRIDVVAIQFNANNNATELVIKKGTPATNPVQPAITRTGAVYELYLASIYRSAGATAVTSSNVTDLRLDKTVCGLMADSITSIDTTAINNQISQFIAELQAEIEGVKNGTDLMLKSVYDPDNDGVLSPGQGGTGKTTHIANAILTGNGTEAVKNIPTESGAFYAPGANEEPRFGILPIKHGGTGGNSAAAARSSLGLGSVSTENIVPIAKGGTGANTVSDALTNLGLGKKLFIQYPLNGINIDTTNGNWTVDISDTAHGTVPSVWVNVTQTTGAHFIVQTAIKCDSSLSQNNRDQRIWIRDKYASNGVWSSWVEIITQQNLPKHELGLKKIWVNPNPTDEYASETQAVADLKNYDMFFIDFRYTATVDRHTFMTVMKNKPTGVQWLETLYVSGNIKANGRRFEIRDGEFFFDDAYEKAINSTSTAVNNNKLIPQAIYAYAIL